jgi:hypothetical protein
MTRRFLCELIQRRFAGGDPSDDFPIQLEEINGWLNFGLAAAAMKNYGDTAALDVEHVADAFYYTFTALPLSMDSATGYYYTTLPQLAYALPKGYDITGVNIAEGGQLSKGFVRIFQNQLDRYRDMRMPPNKSAYWVEGSTLYVNSPFLLDGKSLRVRMASGGDSSDLDSQVGVPDDLVDFVVAQVYNKFLPFMNVKPDLSNDGVNVA